MVILKQMLIFFLIMLLGMFARKHNMLSRNTQKEISAIIVNIANPAMILSGSIGAVKRIKGQEFIFDFLLAIGIFAVLILLAHVVPRVLGFRKEQQAVVKLMFVFSNIGFMGMPMVSAIYGEEGLVYVTLFLIPFNVLLYTYGIAALQKGKRKFKMKGICNIGVIACIGAIVLYFIKVPVPYVISEFIGMLAKLTGPLSMMVIGASLLDIDIKQLAREGSLWGFSIVKMVVIPVLGILLLKQVVTNPVLLGVCLVMLASPVGSMVAILANQTDEEKYTLATKGVSLTTVLSVFTMPLVSWITGVLS